MNNSKVSIGLPVYNGENYLANALDSLLCQDYQDFELVISDNGSNDGTEEICQKYARFDKRIRYYRWKQNNGAAWNYNQVFKLSKGEYFKWAAHDDECHRAFLGRCVEVLRSAPDSVVMVYPQAEMIDEEGKTLATGSDRIGSRDIRPHRRLARILLAMNLCDPVFGLYKTKYLRKTKLIGPFFGADNVLLGELAILGEIWEIDDILFRLRMHSQRSMKANPGARARAAWYDPSAARKLFLLPDWERMVWEMVKSIWRSELHPTEKVKCCMVVPGMHYMRRFRNTGGRIKSQLKAYYSG
jgi:glycosyltransferase involved in cell wall biosynthesis